MKTEEWRQIETPIPRSKNYIKKNIIGIELNGLDRIHLAQNRNNLVGFCEDGNES
jgi:hypothetical protein